MSRRRKRVQVGWYCDHSSEPSGASSHVGDRHKAGRVTKDVAMPETVQSMIFLDYRDPKKVPACPLVERVYVYRDPS